MKNLSRITFVTKSAYEGFHAKLPIDHAEQEAIRKLHLRHGNIGDAFADIFSSKTTGIQISHLSLNDFLSKYPGCTVDDGHLVCGIGGDGTFLLLAQKICNSSVMFLPINPDPGCSIGKLAGFVFDQKFNFKEVADTVLKSLNEGNYQISERTRLQVINHSNPETEYPLGTF